MRLGCGWAILGLANRRRGKCGSGLSTGRLDAAEEKSACRQKIIFWEVRLAIWKTRSLHLPAEVSSLAGQEHSRLLLALSIPEP